MRALRRFWALGISLGVHAVALGALLLRFEPAKLPASGSVEVSMSMAAIEPVSEPSITPDTVTTVAASAAQKSVEPPREVVEAVEPPRESARPVEPQGAKAIPSDVVAAAEPKPDVIRSQAADTAPVPPPPRPRPKAVAEKPKAQAKPEEAAPTRVEPESEPAPETVERPDHAQPGPPVVSEARHTAQATAGRAGPPPDYLNALRAWLERHKEYPRRAQLRGQEGTALLRFTIDDRGRVLSHRVERSTGHPALDREVEAMIRRANPLPVPPPEMRQARLELVVPVQFYLR